ncbi:MAG: hypothetical protein JWM82_3373, partial [Myxococcales bacterium]|nr:hypothetical protein [Myxococcales bacterium]
MTLAASGSLSRFVRVSVCLVALASASSACRKHTTEVIASGAPTPPPDLPRPFGPRTVWIAVHGATTAAVARALELKDVAPSGWEAGVKGAYAGGVFVTPPIDGWVLAASVRFPDAGDATHEDRATPLLARLSDAFGEAQYFGTYDEIGWVAWARFRNGTAVRKHAVQGSQDALLWNVGAPPTAEQALRLTHEGPA